MTTSDTHAVGSRDELGRGPSAARLPSRFRDGTWVAWVVLAILAMELIGGPACLVVVLISGLVVHLLVDSRSRRGPAASADRDTLVVARIAGSGVIGPGRPHARWLRRRGRHP
jgi:hypothetical protein